MLATITGVLATIHFVVVVVWFYYEFLKKGDKPELLLQCGVGFSAALAICALAQGHLVSLLLYALVAYGFYWNLQRQLEGTWRK